MLQTLPIALDQYESSANLADRSFHPLSPRRRGAPNVVVRLSDLLAVEPAVHLADRDTLHCHVNDGQDPILYSVQCGILKPEPRTSRFHLDIERSGNGVWHTNLATYRPGLLPVGDEMMRSIGRWNDSTRLELAQCVRGRVLILTALPDRLRHLLHAQLCSTGDLAVIPPGAWNLTAVINGPADVLTRYTHLNLEQRSPAHGRHEQLASTPERRGGLRVRTPVQVSVVAHNGGVAVTGPDVHAEYPVQMTTLRPGLHEQVLGELVRAEK